VLKFCVADADRVRYMCVAIAIRRCALMLEFVALHAVIRMSHPEKGATQM
jgi:hypothetical protein